MHVLHSVYAMQLSVGFNVRKATLTNLEEDDDVHLKNKTINDEVTRVCFVFTWLGCFIAFLPHRSTRGGEMG